MALNPPAEVVKAMIDLQIELTRFCDEMRVLLDEFPILPYHEWRDRAVDVVRRYDDFMKEC